MQLLNVPDDKNSPEKSYQVEGIGYDFIPDVLAEARQKYIDYWIKTDDKESFIMSRRLIREEGLLCGGSSGSAMVGALIACAKLKKGQRCVVLLADSVRNYMTKFLSDSWMENYEFADDSYLADTQFNTHHLDDLNCADTWQQQAQIEGKGDSN